MGNIPNQAMRCFQLADSINKTFHEEYLPTPILLLLMKAEDNKNVEKISEEILEYYESDSRFGKKERIIKLLRESGMYTPKNII